MPKSSVEHKESLTKSKMWALYNSCPELGPTGRFSRQNPGVMIPYDTDHDNLHDTNEELVTSGADAIVIIPNQHVSTIMSRSPY